MKRVSNYTVDLADIEGGGYPQKTIVDGRPYDFSRNASYSVSELVYAQTCAKMTLKVGLPDGHTQKALVEVLQAPGVMGRVQVDGSAGVESNTRTFSLEGGPFTVRVTTRGTVVWGGTLICQSPDGM